MATVVIQKKDEIIMKLVHYFITEENYTPIVVNGVKDEIWLENNQGPYRIVRINANHIHNDEQYSFDVFKTKNIIKQIKKKTFSLKVNALSIFLDVNDKVALKEEKNIKALFVNSLEDIGKKDTLVKEFPQIKKKLNSDTGVDLIVKITKEINDKTEKENKVYENTFKAKKIVVTKILIILNIITFLAMYLLGNGSLDTITLLTFGASYGPLIKAGQIYRLLTCSFLHIGLMHLAFNMYALWIVGNEVEKVMGKAKFIVIYLASAISGSLLSACLTDAITAGASGAIFGLFGSMLYFGYYYRLYIGDSIIKQIGPVIILNLALGFLIPGIDIAGHIGGLVGGFLITMGVGITNKSSRQEKINGWICYILLLCFLGFLILR